ncbi:hypothetical protein AB0465_17975 [Streptomyces griseoviridis]|uniref:hypothetical protein n=1 Tax=Streptomyces griseoviridis TaxID=45398 RepID=UPI00344FCDCC
MNLNDVAAQVVSILISAMGLALIRLIARFVPEDPPPVPRDPDTPMPLKAPPESDDVNG